MTDIETVTVTLEADGDHDEIDVPTPLLDMLREGEEGDPEIVGDIALFGLAQRIHGAIHHAEGDADEELRAVEEATLSRFEERFGMTFEEATGHSH